MSNMMKTSFSIAAVGALLLVGCSSPAEEEPSAADPAEEIVDIEIAVLEAPSLTSFYAPIIDGLELDIENGIDIKFSPKSTVALRTEMANGSTDVTAGASVLTDAALLNQQGADVVFLFNTYNWWGTVATPTDSHIQDVTDLEGGKIVGALSTTNYAMFKMTAGMNGVDLDTLEEMSSEPAGLVAAAKAGREEAVQLWEPAHTILTLGNDDFRSLDLVGSLQEATGLERIPYVGVAVQRAWLDDNSELIPQLFATFSAAAEFIGSNPNEAAAMISEGTDISQDALEDLFNAPDRFAMDVYPASEATDELETLLEIATEYGVLEEQPEIESLIFSGAIR